MANRSFTAVVLEHLIDSICATLVLAPFMILACSLRNTITPFTTPLNTVLIGALGVVALLLISTIPVSMIFFLWMDITGRLPENDFDEVLEYFGGLSWKKKASVTVVHLVMFIYLISAPSLFGAFLFSQFIKRLCYVIWLKAGYAAVLGAWTLIGLVALAMVPVGVYIIVSDKDLFRVLFKFGDMPRKDKVVAEEEKKN